MSIGFVILIPQSREKNLRLFCSFWQRGADGQRCFASLNMTTRKPFNCFNLFNNFTCAVLNLRLAFAPCVPLPDTRVRVYANRATGRHRNHCDPGRPYFFPAFKAVQNQARSTQAKNDLTQIVNAVNAFYTDLWKVSRSALRLTILVSTGQRAHAARSSAYLVTLV